MQFMPDLELGAILSNKQISEIFGCAIEGGIRKSKRNNCLVVIVNYTKNFHNDHWEGDTLYFTGHGTNPDSWQNRDLADAARNDMPVFLFELHKQGEYIYCGRVMVTGAPVMTDNMPMFKLKKLGT